MSNDTDRDHHSKRRYKTEVKCRRQTQIAKAFGLETDTPHKYAKQHALNCGNPKCVMCGNPRKMFGEETIQEKRNKQKELVD